MDNKKKNSLFAYSYSTTSDDQYEESEDFDLSETPSSDDGSIASAQNRFKRTRDQASNTARPFRRKSFTTSKSQNSQGSRTSSISKSLASEDSTATVRPVPKSPLTPTFASTSALLVASSSTATNDTPSVHNAISPTTTIPANNDGYTPEILDLTDSRPVPSAPSVVPSSFRDRRPPTPITESPNNSMTVETETVSAVPALAVAAAGSGSNNASLKVKKSIDNVNKSVQRAKKKKSRLGGKASKAEVFAARIASAVDEAQSSDSDETFVYESNPHDSSYMASNVNRPRFHTRNSSSSSFTRPTFIQQNPQTQSHPQLSPSLHPMQQVQAQQAQTAHQSGTTSPSIDSYQTLTLTKRSNAQRQYQQQHQQLATSPDQSLLRQPSQSLLQHYVDRSLRPQSLGSPQISPHANLPSGPSYTNSNMSVDNLNNIQDPIEAHVPESQSAHSNIRTHSSPGVLSRQASSASRAQTPSGLASVSSRMVLKKQASSHLRAFAGKQFDSFNGGYKNSGQIPRRWQRGYNDADEEDALYNGINENFVDDDDDDDDNYFSETTPLRTEGSGRSDQRRMRKNGGNSGLRAYSPHNYHRRARSKTRYQRIRNMLGVFLLVLSVLGTGFILGFLLATNKPINSVSIPSIFDVLVSDEELLFDIVVEGVNPGFLTIEVTEIDLDVFARSPYAADDGGGSDTGTGEVSEREEDGDGDGSHVILLGNIKNFEVPLAFTGGFFSKRVQKAVGQLRLIHPGRNTTGSNGGGSSGNGNGNGNENESENDEKGSILDDEEEADIGISLKERREDDILFREKDEDMDSGQQKWAKVNLHPFELIIRGVMHYELPLGGGTHIATMSKVSAIDERVGLHSTNEL